MTSQQIIAALIGRKATDGRITVTIEAWEPFGHATCDVRTRDDASGWVCWRALYELRPVDGEPFPLRRYVCTLRDQESLAQLRSIRAAHVAEMVAKPWPGAEFGKALIGRAIDGAIEDLEKNR